MHAGEIATQTRKNMPISAHARPARTVHVTAWTVRVTACAVRATT